MCCRASLVAQMVKNLPAVQETWVQSLGWEDPQAKGMATHSNILARRIPWTEEPGKLQSMGLQRVRHDWATNIFISWMCCSTMSRSVSGIKTIPCAQHFQPGNQEREPTTWSFLCSFLNTLTGILTSQSVREAIPSWLDNCLSKSPIYCSTSLSLNIKFPTLFPK